MIKYILKQWIVVFARSDWLLSQLISGTTDSPLVPPSERRQTRVSCEQNAFPVCCRHKQKISQLIKQAVPEIHEEGDEVQFGSFNK